LHYNVIQIKLLSIIMTANKLVQARIDGAIKEEATIVLAAMGLTVSDAVRLLLTKVAREHALPFDPLIPNDTTIAAMKEARAGNLPRANSIAALKAALDADD
jgi:DNA-damage-inducible protein J